MEAIKEKLLPITLINSFIYERHDQIKELIADMRENIMSTRLKVASWNPRNKQNSASSMSRQFPSHRSSLFDNEMIALAGKKEQIFQNK
jgi:thymidylate synthase